MRTEERLQALLDAVKLVERDIEHIEFLAALAKDTISFAKNQLILWLDQERSEGVRKAIEEVEEK